MRRMKRMKMRKTTLPVLKGSVGWGALAGGVWGIPGHFRRLPFPRLGGPWGRWPMPEGATLNSLGEEGQTVLAIYSKHNSHSYLH